MNITAETAARLVREQFPHWAGLPVKKGAGWLPRDGTVFSAETEAALSPPEKELPVRERAENA